MKKVFTIIIFAIIVIGIAAIIANYFSNLSSNTNDLVPKTTQTSPPIINKKFPNILSYEINPKARKLHFYTKDEQGTYFQNHQKLKKWLNDKGEKLVFAMNGGMYEKDLSPQGLYIEKGIEVKAIDTLTHGYGNFYLQPNGVFYLSKNNEPYIVTTQNFQPKDSIQYATQSGPMLLIDGHIHPKFNKKSENVHIRNGVGILPNGNLLFAMSKEKVTFYYLANFFKAYGCQNALYLDGFVSRTYLPAKKWTQEDGIYGIIIAETE